MSGEVAVAWMVWAAGAALLVAAGFGAAYAPRMRAHTVRRRTAWSAARAALNSAEVSRDAVTGSVAEAEELFHRAELLIAARGGIAAAQEAEQCAARADRLWQAAADA